MNLPTSWELNIEEIQTLFFNLFPHAFNSSGFDSTAASQITETLVTGEFCCLRSPLFLPDNFILKMVIFFVVYALCTSL